MEGKFEQAGEMQPAERNEGPPQLLRWPDGPAGVLLAFYLLIQGAYDLLNPFALMVFLLLWVLPVVLISDWAGRY